MLVNDSCLLGAHEKTESVFTATAEPNICRAEISPDLPDLIKRNLYIQQNISLLRVYNSNLSLLMIALKFKETVCMYT